jgi:hypothetical protein
MMGRPFRILLLSSLAIAGAWTSTRPTETRWYKGNTHAHTLWSDGNGAPELVTDWYVQHGYDFVALTDHNVWLEGERWFPIDGQEDSRLSTQRVDELRERFGDDAVQVRADENGSQMRLWTLEELRKRFEVPGEFLLIGGEEITDGLPGKPIHVNGLGLTELVDPRGGATVAEVIEGDTAAVHEQGQRLGNTVLAHVNHPNFGWALTAEDLAEMRAERFFEIFNGHPGVNDPGDETRPSTEKLWDMANAGRRFGLDLPLLLGVATDDSHDYHSIGPGRVNPGRGWVMVRAAELSSDAVLSAMHAGDFYATTGVVLDDVRFDGQTLTVKVAAEPGSEHTVRFIGCHQIAGGVEVGVTLAESSERTAVYRVRGDEGFVRAHVTSTRPVDNPRLAEGETAQAWTQPVRIE